MWARRLSNTALGTTNIAAGGERTSFVRDPSGGLVSMVAWEGEERFHYTTDHQNSVLALTAEGSGAETPDAVYEYTPYGERTDEIAEDTRAGELNPFGYTGAYQFLDGTTHLGHRFLDAATLNFTQADPSRQEMNNYAYAMGDPINRVDWAGLMSQAAGGAAIGAGLAGAAAGALFGAGCLATIACGMALFTTAALWSAGGGAAGATIAGGSDQEIENGMWGGMGSGILGAALGPFGNTYSALAVFPRS